jgi:glutamate-1-semialdehyde 2,1-aminomutase
VRGRSLSTSADVVAPARCIWKGIIRMTHFGANVITTDQHIRTGSRGLPLLPGGLGRSAYNVGDAPTYAIRGEGYRIWDDRGNELIDANNNFTVLVHGNAHPEISEAAERALRSGVCWGISKSVRVGAC